MIRVHSSSIIPFWAADPNIIASKLNRWMMISRKAASLIQKYWMEGRLERIKEKMQKQKVSAASDEDSHAAHVVRVRALQDHFDKKPWVEPAVESLYVQFVQDRGEHVAYIVRGPPASIPESRLRLILSRF